MAADGDPRIVQHYVTPWLIPTDALAPKAAPPVPSTAPLDVDVDIDIDEDEGPSAATPPPLPPPAAAAAAAASTADAAAAEGAAHGHKFHIRVLALVVGVMDTYLFDECRVLISPVPMEVPMRIDIQDAPGTRGGGGTVDAADAGGEAETEVGAAAAAARASEAGAEAEGAAAAAAAGAGDLHAHITNRSFNKAHGAYAAGVHNQPLSQCGALAGGGDGKFFEVRW